MKWPWVSRKRFLQQIDLAHTAIIQRDDTMLDLVKAHDLAAKHERNSKTLGGVVGTLRAELIAKKQDIKVLMQKLADKDTVIDAQHKEIERLEKSLPVSLNPRRKHFHGAGGIKERLEAEAANEKKSTVPEGAN